MNSNSFSRKTINQTIVFLFFSCLLIVFTTNSTWASEKARKSISGPELYHLIETDQAPMIIDVRSSREYKDGHIQGSINISFRSNFAKIDEVMADPERLIVVYCAYGPRASWAQRNMRKAGLKNAILLTGHISKWKKKKLPLIE